MSKCCIISLNASIYNYRVRIVFTGQLISGGSSSSPIKCHQSHSITFNFNQQTGVVDVVSVAALLLSSVCCSVQPEELTLLLIKLRRQQAELNSLREHTVAQLMALGMEGPNAKVSTECVQYVCVHARICALPTKQPKSHILCVCLCKWRLLRLLVYSR